VSDPLVAIEGVTRRFEGKTALEAVSAVIPAGRVTGLVGPDGAGKTTLIRLLAGLLLPDAGRLSVCGFDPATEAGWVHDVTGYMPQRFGLYEDLTVTENMALHADLRGVTGTERAAAFDRLDRFTGLGPFGDRLAGKLSGGMKQKLGLACALIRVPRLLLLDEPSVGVDPLSRRELWRMVSELVGQGIGVLWSTAYLDEAERCDRVLLLDRGRLLHDGPPADFTGRVAGRSFALRGLGADKRTVQARAETLADVRDALIQGRTLRLVMAEGRPPPSAAVLGVAEEARPVPSRFEDAFVARLREEEAPGRISTPPRESPRIQRDGPAVEAEELTRDFGDFRAVDRVTFSVTAGEILGLLGPNGAGKSTTFKMLCGLLEPSAGLARVAGIDLGHAPAEARARIGYMSQKFSLYGQLGTGQNLDFFAGVYGLSGKRKRQAIERRVAAFELGPHLKTDAGLLPLGFKQRLALACATLHDPAILFLDEPTSGVDPLTRREFWRHINAMASHGVTVLVTTHFLDEAEYCDRVGIVFRGKLIALDTPDALKEAAARPDRPDPSLDDAFVDLIAADADREAA
jgi:ABC-2 type transport system ATP-binding protein